MATVRLMKSMPLQQKINLDLKDGPLPLGCSCRIFLPLGCKWRSHWVSHLLRGGRNCLAAQPSYYPSLTHAGAAAGSPMRRGRVLLDCRDQRTSVEFVDAHSHLRGQLPVPCELRVSPRGAATHPRWERGREIHAVRCSRAAARLLCARRTARRPLHGAYAYAVAGRSDADLRAGRIG